MKQPVLVVIPAHNEENTIADILIGLRRAAPEYDRVVVNDGSRDRTGDIVAQLGEKQLRLPCNLGYGQALQTGLKYALIKGYEIIVCMDADGQHRAEDVPYLVHALSESDADMVIGSRFYNGRYYDSPVDRRLGQLLFSHLTRLLIGKRIYDTSSGFKALRAGACAVIANGTFVDLHLETIVQLSLSGFQIVEVPITARKRASGNSMHSWSSVLRYPLKTLVLTVVTAIDILFARKAK